MNEDLILSMARPYVENGSITYEQFGNIYDMLSRREQDTVSEILNRNGINLVDGEEQIDEDTYILEAEEQLEDDAEEFQVLYDEGIFRDSHPSIEDNVVINLDIKQSNEILCVLIQQGNKQAEQDLCVKNKKLVDKCVIAYQKMYGNRIDFDDLEQVGFMGLIRAAKKFDIQQGNAFSTCAVYWIRQAISREITNNGYLIRIPVHMMEKISKVAKAESLYTGLGIRDRIQKISEKLSMTKEAVEECLILRKNYLSYASLDAHIGAEEGTELRDIVPEGDVLSVEDMVTDRDLRYRLEKVLSTLTHREELVLRLRFGFDDCRARSLEEVGAQFNVSRERIRQIESIALRKLRYPSRANKVRDYLD